MDIVLRGLALIGMAAGFAAWIWIVIMAFTKSPGWGLFALALPPAGPIWFIVKHPKETIKPILLGVGGMVAMIVGIMATQP